MRLARKSWWYGILFVNLAMLLPTLFRYELRESGGLVRFLALLNLTSENNLASWWSGALLILIALHAFDGYSKFKTDQPGVARGWAALSLIFLLLSADEIGSLHERANHIPGIGSWIALLPFALVLLGLFAYALFLLWPAKAQRPAVRFLILGFGCFAAAVFQEVLEHRFVWEGWLKSVRGGIEEGTELLGMMLLLRACLPNSGGRLGGEGLVDAPVFEGVCAWRRAFLALGLPLALALAYVSMVISDPGWGRPGDWPASASFLLAGAAAGSSFLRGQTSLRFWNGSRVLLCLLASMCVIVLGPSLIVSLPGLNLEASLRGSVLAGVSLLLLLTWLLPGHEEGGQPIPRKPVARTTGLLFVLAILNVVLIGAFPAACLPALLGLVVYAVQASRACAD